MCAFDLIYLFYDSILSFTLFHINSEILQSVLKDSNSRIWDLLQFDGFPPEVIYRRLGHCLSSLKIGPRFQILRCTHLVKHPDGSDEMRAYIYVRSLIPT